jgi:signal transduction histidine kinase
MDMTLKTEGQGPAWRLSDVLIARSVLVTSVAAGALLLAFAGQTETATARWVAGAAVLAALSNIPLFLLASRGRQRLVSWTMVLLDCLFITLLVYVTSGTESALAIFFLWPVISACLLLGARAGYVVTALSGALYLGMAILQQQGVDPPDLLLPYGPSGGSGVGAALIGVVGFMLIALLCGMLSSTLLQSNEGLLLEKWAAAREIRNLKDANHRLTVLQEMSEGLRRIQELEVLLPRAQIRLVNFAGADAGFMVVNARQSGEARIAARHNIDEHVCRSLLTAGLVTQVSELEEFPVAETPNSRGESAVPSSPVDRAGFYEYLAAPLRVADESLGTLYLFTKPKRHFRKEDVALLGNLTSQVAVAIKNVLFTQQLKEANEELLHVDQLKSDFLATMSHELRTPLTAVIGYTDMLMSGLVGDVGERQKELLRNILNSGEALLNLINDILDITKIEAGKLELNLEPVELRSVLISVLTVLKPRAREKQIRISTFLPTDLPPILADSSKLAQILLNLLANAVKFTHELGSVSIEARSQPEGIVEVRVTDTGIGIAQEDLGRIFDRFTQIDSSSSRLQGGTGLGLSITKDLIGLHGGTIKVQSQLSRGTTFVFTIPQALENQDHLAAGKLA